MLHPAFVLAESLTRGTSWRLAGRLLRVLENMHSPKVGLGEASLRDSDKHACGACRCDSPRARMAARFADSSTGAGYGPVPTGHREVRYPYLERGPRKGEAPAVVGKLQAFWRPINRSLIERMNQFYRASRGRVSANG